MYRPLNIPISATDSNKTIFSWHEKRSCGHRQLTSGTHVWSLLHKLHKESHRCQEHTWISRKREACLTIVYTTSLRATMAYTRRLRSGLISSLLSRRTEPCSKYQATLSNTWRTERWYNTPQILMKASLFPPKNSLTSLRSIFLSRSYSSQTLRKRKTQRRWSSHWRTCVTARDE